MAEQRERITIAGTTLYLRADPGTDAGRGGGALPLLDDTHAFTAWTGDLEEGRGGIEIGGRSL